MNSVTVNEPKSSEAGAAGFDIDEPVAAIELSEGEIRFYQEEGYLYLPGLCGENKAGLLREEVIDIMEQSGFSREYLSNPDGAQSSLIQSGQYLRGSGLDSLVNSSNLLSLASQLMQGPGSVYFPFTAVKSGDGGGSFRFHQDNQFTRFDGPGINIWFALSPMTPENGCLQMVPRSHLSGTLEPLKDYGSPDHRSAANDPTRFLPVRMRPGDAIAFSRLTLHGSGVNQTSEPRVGYAIQFHRNDVRGTWNGETHLLREHPRWEVGPVDKITRPTERSRDGH